MISGVPTEIKRCGYAVGMAPLMGLYYLQGTYGGECIPPAGVLGVKPAKALIQ
jgi:hypothetical protein